MYPLFRMFRPGNVAIATFSVYFAAWIGGAQFEFPGIWLDGIVLGLLAALGNLHNDLVDLPIDRINQPQRALPAGLVTPRQVKWTLFLGLGITAVLVAFRPLPMQLFFAAVFLLLFIYNRWLKGLPLLGNLAVASLCASALFAPLLDFSAWFPGSNPAFLLPLVAFSFLFTLTREFIKDMEDLQGDSAHGLHTLPILIGIPLSRGVACFLILLCVLSTVIPWRMGLYPASFTLVCAFLVFPALGNAVWSMRASQNDWRSAQKALKIAMVGGLFASLLVFRALPMAFWL